MADKPHIISKEAQAAWARAVTAADKSAAVKQFPELRHLFAQAARIHAAKTPAAATEPAAKTPAKT